MVVALTDARRWANVTGASTLYPSNGVGGTTGTAGSSETVNATGVLIVGVLITQVTGTVTFTLETHSGTSLMTIAGPGAAACPYWCPLGIKIKEGWRASFGASSTAMVQYTVVSTD